MAKFSFDILFLSEKDFEKVIAITKKYKIDCEQLEHREGKRYLLHFESDYGEYEFFNEFEQIFEFDYLKLDKLILGKYDIRINISRSQDPYFRDSWGRPLETDESDNWYFVKPADRAKRFPTKKITYTLKGKKRWIWLGVTKGENPKTKKTGYIIIANEENSRKPINPNSGYILTNNIYQTVEDAFEDGTRQIEDRVNKLS